MDRTNPISFALVLLLCCGLLPGCATVGPGPADRHYAAMDETSRLGRYAPIIVPGESGQPYNRVGRAAARLSEDGEEQIFIATDQAVYYTAEQGFTSVAGQDYDNLIYRLHFPRVPQPHLTAGANGGLFVIITLDGQQRPLLITTVHTCGCYLGFVPTSYLPASAYPEQWPQEQQRVFGETLPARLDYPPGFDAALRPLIHLRSGTHRVMDIQLRRLSEIDAPLAEVRLLPLAGLERLPLGEGHTSFFHTSGWLQGYVKDSFKPWELLLMSWWALDLNIGRDKQLGTPDQTGTVFYTSLKPWARNASNMGRFADFLAYWGWRL